jgi:hypothetical protein
LEVDAPRRLVLKWRNEFRPEVEIEPVGDVKLTITRAIARDQSNFIDAVSGVGRAFSPTSSIA